MSWSNPNAPNLPDFILFIRNSMRIPVSGLPADSVWPGYAFNQAMALVLNVPTVSGLEYTLAVYNCGGHILIRITPDIQGSDFFAQLRSNYEILKPWSGMPSSTSDQGTSASFSVPDGIANLSIGDLNFYRTPWGREYLSYAQDFGSIWGLT